VKRKQGEIQMKYGIKQVLIILLSFIVVGCGSAQYIKTSYTDDSCLLYVFRDSFTLMYSFDIEIDNKTYAKLSDETYTSIYLPTGARTVKANWFPGSGGVDLDVEVTCDPKETKYIAFTGEVDGIVGGITRKIYSIGLTKKTAEKRMKNYKKIGG
jgi:peptidoglycan hydrolase-like protein with peptidoglycan-binding domain